MKDRKQKLIVVIGMHRSGTSAITRGLRVLQVEMGNSLIPGEAGRNERGYWEDSEINVLNERLLERLGTTWHGLRDLKAEDFLATEYVDLKDEAKSLLGRKTQDVTVFGFKDPRISILLPFWQPIFRELDFEDRYLIALRNPLDVAKSLENRDGFPHQKSFLLWVKHNIGALKYTSGQLRVVVSYDALLKSPEAEINRIAKTLELELTPGQSDALHEYADQFLTKDLRHSYTSQSALKQSSEMPPFVRKAYASLLSVAKDKMQLDSQAFCRAWTRIEKSYIEFVPINAYIDVLHSELHEAQAQEKKASHERNEAQLIRDHLSKQKERAEQERDVILREKNSDKQELEGLKRELAQQAELARVDKEKLQQDQVDALQAMSAKLQESEDICEDLTQKIELSQTERETAQKEREVALMERDKLAVEKGAAISEREETLQAMDAKQQELESLQQEFAQQTQLSQQHEKELELIRNSNSWRLTRPLRGFRRELFTRPYWTIRQYLSDSIRKSWKTVPLTPTRKRRLKGILFRAIPIFLSRTMAYRAWKEFERQQVAAGMIVATSSDQVPDQETEQDLSSSVPLLDAPPLANPPVCLIAFYLPQFHPIPENDEWWGEGFTEWTNVRPAKPQFVGHYQPRIPGELGYYDLRDTAVQKRQVELAKLYGVGGFCFYVYWFGGKRLLETPVINYLNDSSLDLPFCLCWANENWSRRWDGLDSEILMAQQHSPEDDLAFIEYVSRYLQDPRNIRIDDRPLLLVYRPSLLPSPKETADRWRTWCRENGIGEIYLAYTQSFETVDPRKYGFDAAVEFPPNNMSPPLISEGVTGRTKTFTGQIYDWSVFPERSKAYKKPAYTLFRGVNPSWDNTARRKSNATILYGSSPMYYQQWLYNAAKETVGRISSPDEQLVFVNAWNEWAEGAYLEPDQRYGYAYLEATRMALQKAAASLGMVDQASNQVLAIVVHVFYLDVFEEILHYISAIGINTKLYVTTTFVQEDQVKEMLDDSSKDFHLLAVENRGRDVLPFLKIIPFVIGAGHEFVLKLHTKKSKHRVDGDIWRNDLYEKLMAPKSAKHILEMLNSNHDLGMVGPEGHIVPMTTYWGCNEKIVLRLAERMGIDQKQVVSMAFVAGTMFYVRVTSLLPILNLSIDEKDFEQEAGQVDGTLAHAIERVFSIGVFANEKKLTSTDCFTDDDNAMLTKQYPFVS